MTIDEQLKDLRARFTDIKEREAKLTFEKGQFDKDIQVVIQHITGSEAKEVNVVELLCKARAL